MEHIGRYLAYVYLLRVPLIAWCALFILPFMALPSGASVGPLLRGLFDIGGGSPQQSFLSFFFVTTATLLTAATIGVIARLIILDGEERFGAGHIPRGREIGANGIRLMLRVIPLSIAIPLIGGAFYQTIIRVPRWEIGATVMALLGIGVGVAVFYFVMTWLHEQIWNEVVIRKVTPSYRVNLINSFIRFLSRIVYFFWNTVQAVVFWLSPEGYIDPRNNELRPRHIFAVVQLVISIGFYLYLFITKKYYSYLHTAQNDESFLRLLNPWDTLPVIPTLCLLLVLIMFVSWGSSALTFFFDRFRIPVLVLLVIWAWAVSFFPQGDHFYSSTSDATSRLRLSPAEVLSQRSGKPAILVATSGGGIQSAAWTVRVLSGLRRELEKKGDGKANEFDRAIRLISSVSGGSVGAMYIVDAYQSEGLLPEVGASLDTYEPLTNAEASSLDSVAWGLVYPDFVWNLIPFAKGFYFYPFFLINGPNLTTDRGTSLEDAWRRTKGLKTATMNQWRRDVSKGKRPAVIFNATIVETGERMLLSTTDMEVPEEIAVNNSAGWKAHNDLHPARDISVVTAARLSATFPFVTPAARITKGNVFESEYHVVDGGYYDNHGVASLIEWLDQAMENSASKPSRVLILQIRGSPAGIVDPPKGEYGWVFQTTHAFQTLANVRGTAQFSRNEVELKLIKRLCDLEYKVPCQIVSFEFKPTDRHKRPMPGPLSWHLTPGDIENLRVEWNRHCPPLEPERADGRNCDEVINFLKE